MANANSIFEQYRALPVSERIRFLLIIDNGGEESFDRETVSRLKSYFNSGNFTTVVPGVTVESNERQYYQALQEGIASGELADLAARWGR
jgi:hypothetical protein